MTRSLSLLFLSFLVLTLICLQGAFGYIEEGIYLIETLDEEFLSIGPVAPDLPPPDVPARLSTNPHGDEIWEVLQANFGGYIIRQRGDPEWAYILNRDEYETVIVSSSKAPQTWAVDKAGPDVYTIKVIDEDNLVTAKGGSLTPVILRPADGSRYQRWKFTRMDSLSYTRGGMYGKSRFNVQCAL